jgi:hypothetical protein
LIERYIKAPSTGEGRDSNFTDSDGSFQLFPLNWKFELDADDYSIGTLAFLTLEKIPIVHFDLVPVNGICLVLSSSI